MPTVLVHGASIGELLAADPIVERMRAALPAVGVVYSHTSPSVSQWPHWPADRVMRVAPPLPGLIGRWFRKIGPEVVLLSRGDLWPPMLEAAYRTGVPVAVIGGRMRPDSRRLQWPLRGILAPVVEPMAQVAAVTETDAEGWRRLGAAPERVTVTGDPAADRLLDRTPDAAVVAALRAWAGDDPVLVIGSMEPSDTPLTAALLAEAPRAIVVPHDPERMPAAPAAAPWAPGGPLPAARVLHVTARGVLADCYHVARAVYVGGGLEGRSHNRDEPAVAAAPVLEAAEPSALVAAWIAYRDDAETARRAGQAARARLEAMRGAADRTWKLIEPLFA